MSKTIMKVEGFDGQVELLEDRIIIRRQGWWNALTYGFNAKTEIPLMAISEVSFKPPLLLGMGTIDFIRSGRVSQDMKRGSSTAVKFKKIKLQEFEAFKEKVFEMITQNQQSH